MPAPSKAKDEGSGTERRTGEGWDVSSIECLVRLVKCSRVVRIGLSEEYCSVVLGRALEGKVPEKLKLVISPEETLNVFMAMEHNAQA